MILALHEEDSNHIAELKHVFAVPQRYGESTLQTRMTLPVLPDVDFIVACPFARGNMGYQGSPSRMCTTCWPMWRNATQSTRTACT